jgi:hypothetical protein
MPAKNRIVLIILCATGLLYFFMASTPLLQGEGQPSATTMPPIIDLSWPQQLERLGLVGSLLVAVWILWNTYQKSLQKKDDEIAKKDEVLMALVVKVTESLGGMQEFRRVLEASTTAKTELTEEFRLLQSKLEKFLK